MTRNEPLFFTENISLRSVARSKISSILYSAGFMIISLFQYGNAVASEGLFQGTITVSGPCDLGPDDRRMCHHLALKGSRDSTLGGNLWGGVEIIDADGRTVHSENLGLSSAASREVFAKATEGLAIGQRARVRFSCHSEGCDITRIQLNK